MIFINDLPEMAYSTAKIFADDIKLFRTITSEGDRHQLQEDLKQLKHLVTWSEKWQLGFNEGKCKVLHLGNSNPRHTYHMNEVALSAGSEEKDLGVIIDEELKFHKHAAAGVKKSSRMLGLIRTTFTCLDEITIPRLFTNLVRPHLALENVLRATMIFLTVVALSVLVDCISVLVRI